MIKIGMRQIIRFAKQQCFFQTCFRQVIESMGEMINKYELLNPFQSRNAGFSRWTLAKKGERLFFLKELIDPKYPDEELLSESIRAGRIKECEKFEKEKSRLYSAINTASDGNLVRLIEFFRVDSRYYVSSYWIDQAVIDLKRIARMDLKDKLLLCRTAVHSLAALHEQRIVHADIKDTNVLIHKTKNESLVTKIVDFDCSFFEDTPPDNEDDLGGDQVYLSPEACLFLCGEEVELTCKMDVFALGILLHQFLTGDIPYFDSEKYDYAHEAVLDDVILKADTADIPLPVRRIIENMLLKDPQKRISAKEVYFLLTSFYNQTYPVSRPLIEKEEVEISTKPSDMDKETKTSSSRLRMSKEFFQKPGDL